MKFEQSYTGYHSKHTPAEEIFAGWEILWEYDNSEDVFSETARFLAKKGDKYCIGNYKMHIPQNPFSRNLNPILFGNMNERGDAVVNPNRWSDRDKESYLRHSLFFENMHGLVTYAKKLKQAYGINDKNSNRILFELLIAIKKEYLSIQEYRNKYQNRNRLDMVEDV